MSFMGGAPMKHFSMMPSTRLSSAKLPRLRLDPMWRMCHDVEKRSLNNRLSELVTARGPQGDVCVRLRFEHSYENCATVFAAAKRVVLDVRLRSIWGRKRPRGHAKGHRNSRRLSRDRSLAAAGLLPERFCTLPRSWDNWMERASDRACARVSAIWCGMEVSIANLTLGLRALELEVKKKAQTAQSFGEESYVIGLFFDLEQLRAACSISLL